jgi:hypothetical protein
LNTVLQYESKFGKRPVDCVTRPAIPRLHRQGMAFPSPLFRMLAGFPSFF